MLSAVQWRDKSLQLDLIDSLRVPIWLRTFLTLPPWLLGVLGFTVYYIIPLLWSAVAGVLISPQIVSQQFEPVGLGSIGSWLARSASLRREAALGATPLYYAADLTHFAMSVVTWLAGATLMITALQRFGGVFEYLVTSGQLCAPREAILKEIERTRKRCGNVGSYAAFIALAVFLAAFFLSRTQHPSFAWWWGHRSHGFGGSLFCVGVGIMIAGGAASVYLLAGGLSAVSRLLLYPVQLRPMHPDGCNGFGRFGDYLVLLFFLSVAIATATSITFWAGYMGIERFVATWIMSAVVLLAIPLLLIAPLVRCTLQIGRAKHFRLSGVEHALNEVLVDIESRVTSRQPADSLRDELQRLVDIRKSLGEVYGGHNFPFRARIAGVLSLSYVVQVILLVRQAFDQLTPGP